MDITILAGLMIALAIAVSILRMVTGDWRRKKPYQYTRKQFFLTRAEHEFYNVLLTAVGDRYHIFAQVHLPTILDNKVIGQSWHAARSHIDRKSVDFVLCDKKYLSPKLAIELDDKSHELLKRKARDKEVERILADADLPLLRIESKRPFDAIELAQRIQECGL